jgi:SSS family solute:Na+ symporter
MHELPRLDVAVLVAYLVGTVGLGCYFMVRSRRPENFMAAGRSLPGWLLGLSIFGTYVSSISFLALPSVAFIRNWNPLAFSLSLPLACWIATRWFVPFYRETGTISAYDHLQHRFGGWARTYALACYLLTQVSRLGTVMYLLALSLHQLLGWDLVTLILVTGGLTTLYTLLGGIEGVIWTDAAQSIVLIVGALACAVILPFSMPEGPGQMFRIATEHGKFSLGSFGPSLTEATFWVVLVYGLFTNLQNFGIDQNYVQRYAAARTERDAARSVWLGGLMYLPVSAFFLFIGTGLFAFYTAQPDLLPESLRAAWAEGKGDNVFPYFIVDRLPHGMAGLVIAAVFAAAMSTLSSSLNSSATLTLTDLYRRFLRPGAGDRESMRVLYVATLFWGILGTGTALAMIRVRSALDAWWELSSIFSGGMLGLFLLGRISRRAKRPAAAAGVVVGVCVIAWMVLSPKWNTWFELYPLPAALQNPLHNYLAIVAGTLAIFAVGILVSRLFGAKEAAPAADTSGESVKP